MAEDQTLFASVIEQHLALKRRNAELEPDMPLEEFIPADPFDNHALFKTEADAQSEEEETGEHPASSTGRASPAPAPREPPSSVGSSQRLADASADQLCRRQRAFDVTGMIRPRLGRGEPQSLVDRLAPTRIPVRLVRRQVLNAGR